MKIFTLTSIAGIGLSCPPRTVVEYPDEAEAKRMIAAGNARKPTEAELVVHAERKKDAAAAAKSAADFDKKTAAIVKKANKKRADAANKAHAKKLARGSKPVGRPKKSKKKKTDSPPPANTDSPPPANTDSPPPPPEAKTP